MRFCNYCGQTHNTTGCPPRYVPVSPIPTSGSLEPRLTLIPSDFLQDGQRIPTSGDTIVVSRTEYNRIYAALTKTP